MRLAAAQNFSRGFSPVKLLTFLFARFFDAIGFILQQIVLYVFLLSPVSCRLINDPFRGVPSHKSASLSVSDRKPHSARIAAFAAFPPQSSLPARRLPSEHTRRSTFAAEYVAAKTPPLSACREIPFGSSEKGALLIVPDQTAAHTHYTKINLVRRTVSKKFARVSTQTRNAASKH